MAAQSRPLQKGDPILVTGADGFVGRNLVLALQNRGYTNVLRFDRGNTDAELAAFCAQARFCLSSGRGQPPPGTPVNSTTATAT